jgi:hypothetical protein
MAEEAQPQQSVSASVGSRRARLRACGDQLIGRHTMKTLAASRALLAVLACVGTGSVAGPALADAGGVPHGGSSSCGVGKTEAQAFIADPSQPGASEINQYPPTTFGCTGQSQ